MDIQSLNHICPSANTTQPALPPQRPVPESDFQAAVQQWRAVLGTEHVLTDQATLDDYARCTLPRGTRPRAVLRPGSTEEVSRVAAIANAHRVPIYPISCGKNWGYGDRCAPTDGQVIVELARMNRILEVNTELAYAVIEPGVTQGQLSQYLRNNDIPLWLDVTGAGPDASIVGNTLERGFGHTPYGDHFAHSCGMEIVLPDGRVLQTGFGRFANAQARWVYPWGVGPWIDGLFTQSSFGIITRLGIWLLPKPQRCLAFAMKIAEHGQLAALIDRLRWLRLHGVLNSTVHVANDLRVISASQSYPVAAAQGIFPLPESVRNKLRRQAGIGLWNVMGALYGTRSAVAAARKEVRRTLSPLGKVHFFGDRLLSLGMAVARWLERLGLAAGLCRTVRSAASVYALLCGQPAADHLNGIYWRSGLPKDQSPDPVSAGLMWLSPVLPMTGQACTELLGIVEPMLARYGFEPLITFTAISPRALVCVISIYYDKHDPHQTAQAGRCYDCLLDELIACGYVPYRTSIQGMARLRQQHGCFGDLLGQLKTTVDPHAILGPGRYV